jgi:hypothetical protein
METKRSLPCSQQRATGTYSEPDESNLPSISISLRSTDVWNEMFYRIFSDSKYCYCYNYYNYVRSTIIILIIIIIRGATALTKLGRLSSRRWQSFPTAPDGTGLTYGQHIDSHSCIFSFPKKDRYFFIQVTTQFIRSRGWVDPVPDPTPSEKS